MKPGSSDGKPSLVPRGPLGTFRALVWSLQGLRHAFRFESSFRLQVYLFAVLAPLAFVLGRGPVEKLLMFGSLVLVLAAELLNSSIEAIADKISPGFDETIGRVKDMGSAAVFVLMVNVVVCWALLLAPRIGM
ncbi:MAG TPA: diacylglycerol kinase [Candidatus Saccharimonadia bacterium]|nr:diacylglycerol kinase [Candidatus Saccharimonadia bacterium]